MTDAEIKAGCLSIEPLHPFMLSLKALMQSAVLSEQAAVTAPNLTDAARHFNAGRLAQAMDFESSLSGIIEDARQEADRRLAEAAARAAMKRAEGSNVT